MLDSATLAAMQSSARLGSKQHWLATKRRWLAPASPFVSLYTTCSKLARIFKEIQMRVHRRQVWHAPG